MARHFTFEERHARGSAADRALVHAARPTSRRSTASSPGTAGSEPPQMPAGQRAGHAHPHGVVDDRQTRRATRCTAARQLARAIHVRGAAPPEPADLPPGALDQPPVSPDQTTRERYEIKTADEVCQGCHSLINPVGFVLEGYDAIGRYRDRGARHRPGDRRGRWRPAADRRRPRRCRSAAARRVSSGRELTEQVVASGQAEACFAKQYFRATFGREETSDDDVCTLDAITTRWSRRLDARGAARRRRAACFRSRRVQ